MDMILISLYQLTTQHEMKYIHMRIYTASNKQFIEWMK